MFYIYFKINYYTFNFTILQFVFYYKIKYVFRQSYIFKLIILTITYYTHILLREYVNARFDTDEYIYLVVLIYMFIVDIKYLSRILKYRVLYIIILYSVKYQADI